jgi:predicted DsbA family dithiol-disulfide isomerase
MAVDLTKEKIEVDVYFDYACPYAWASQVWLDQVSEELGNNLQINWRYFPLEQVNAKDPGFKVWEQPNDGSSSTLRSFQAAHAAQKQGQEAFERFHAALFKKRHVDGRNLAGQQVLEAAAEEAGLDLEQFRADLESDEVFEVVREDYEHGKNELGVFGTPTVVFDNELGAYVQINFREMPDDPVQFWRDFVETVRDRPSVLEIKRPRRPQK